MFCYKIAKMPVSPLYRLNVTCNSWIQIPQRAQKLSSQQLVSMVSLGIETDSFFHFACLNYSNQQVVKQ